MASFRLGFFSLKLGKLCRVRLSEWLGHTLGDTMKYETSELGGLKLDQAVAKALGASPPFAPGKCRDVVGLIDTPPYEYDDDFLPSSIWAHGGPIIDREGIELPD